jgi:hypothetical protein
MSLSSVKPDRLLVDVLRSRGLNPKTINRYLYAVSGALRWALRRELIPGMPIIPRQTEGVGRIAFLTEEDQQRVIQWLTDHLLRCSFRDQNSIAHWIPHFGISRVGARRHPGRMGHSP